MSLDSLIRELRNTPASRVADQLASAVSSANVADSVQFLGEIVADGPAGEADYADARYWVRRVSVASGTSNDNLSTTKLIAADDRAVHVTAVNLAEVVAGTHSVAVGETVIVVRSQDAGANTRYVFSQGVTAASDRITGVLAYAWSADQPSCSSRGSDASLVGVHAFASVSSTPFLWTWADGIVLAQDGDGLISGAWTDSGVGDLTMDSPAGLLVSGTRIVGNVTFTGTGGTAQLTFGA